MKKIILLRFNESPTLPTSGVLLTENHHPVCFTLEPPWKDNAKNVSCIPLGTYRLRPKHSAKFGTTLEVTGVPDRSQIIFHGGNSLVDTRGCILLGLEHSAPPMQNIVPHVSSFASSLTFSTPAVVRFRNLVSGYKELSLEIRLFQ